MEQKKQEPIRDARQLGTAKMLIRSHRKPAGKHSMN